MKPSHDLKLYFRDLLFFLVTCAVSVFIAETVIFTENKINLTTRLFTYAYLIVPLFLVVMVLSYTYRTRRIEKTGIIRSSIRYKLIIAFIFVSILPSIPIVLLSGDLIEKSISSFFSIDVKKGLEASLRVSNYHFKTRRRQFLKKLNSDELIGIYNLTVLEKRLQQKNLLVKNEYTAFADAKNIIGENTPLLAGTYENLEFRPLKKHKGIESTSFGSQDNTFELFRIRQGNDRYLIIGKLFNNRLMKDLRTIRKTYKAYSSANYFKERVSVASQVGLFLVSLLLVLAAVIVSFNLARQISEPLMSLAFATRRITQGEHDQKIELEAKGEMGILIESFNQMVVSIASYKQQINQTQRLSVWKEVAQRVAHEIKNPLTPIQLNAERMRRKFSKIEDNSEQMREMNEFVSKSVGVILQEVDIIKRLVNEFSQFARMPNPKKEPGNIVHIFQEVCKAYEGREGLQFIVNYKARFPDFQLDRGLIHQVFSNLLKNSVEAMQDDHGNLKDDAVIEVNFFTRQVVEEKVYCISVEDNGPTTPASVREKLFEPYFSTKKEGTGIGLAISEKILVDHNAKITAVNSDRYSGLKFEIQFEEAKL